MTVSSETNQPVPVPRPSPRPVAKKVTAGSESSAVVSGNVQQATLKKDNKKHSNPAEDEDENVTDPTTPIQPTKKIKGSMAQTAHPLRRTGILLYVIS